MGRSLPQSETKLSKCDPDPLGWSDCPVEMGRNISLLAAEESGILDRYPLIPPCRSG